MSLKYFIIICTPPDTAFGGYAVTIEQMVFVLLGNDSNKMISMYLLCNSPPILPVYNRIRMEYNLFQANTFLTGVSLFQVMVVILSPLHI